MPRRVSSIDLHPGMVLRHPSGATRTLDRRKNEPGEPGWWNTDGTGFSDAAIDSEQPSWVVEWEDGRDASPEG